MKQHWIWLMTLAVATAFFTCSAGVRGDVPPVEITPRKAAMLERPTPWADSLMETLTLDQMIGQLFMIPAYSNQGVAHENEVRALIDNYEVGGLIFMQGSPHKQVTLTNDYQQRSKVPLLIAMDAEWGPGMRLDSTIRYPRQMTLGAANSPGLTYQFGLECARQLRALGVHVNFGPVVDVNNNPKNPVINNRSFGENRQRVAVLGDAYARGLQDGRVLACAKHFPGHGDTDVDSHKDLPYIMHDRARLDSLELYPFRELAKTGLGSVMIAHLYVPALDSTALKPSTLSEKIVTDLLRDSLGFEGLVFTDAMTMQGLAKYFEPGEMHVKALEAGNDVLLFPGDVKVALARIKQAIADSVLTKERIAERCHRVLKTKEWAGLHNWAPHPLEGLTEGLNDSRAQALEHRIAGEALTVLRNQNGLLPLGPDTLKWATLTIGGDGKNAFVRTVDRHLDAAHLVMSRNPDFSTLKSMQSKLGKYDVVLAVFENTSNRGSKNYNITQDALRMLAGVDAQVAVGITANPYALRKLRDWESIDAVVVAYQDSEATLEELAEMMVGARGAQGRLPVTISAKYPEGFGLVTQPNGRLSMGFPEDTGIEATRLAAIDTIAVEGIAEQAFPGCRVLVVKEGTVVYDKAFGHHTYAGKKSVTQETVYDLASITKVAASTVSLMALHEQGQVHPDYNLCDYLAIPDSNDHFNMNLREMLSHTARLKPWIPFYSQTLVSGGLDPSVYKRLPSDGYTVCVADQCFIMDTYVDSMKQVILQNGLRENRDYRYSDLGYYFVKDIIEQQTGTGLADYALEHYYRPLGLHSMRYNPLGYMDRGVIAPTEEDGYFRGQLIHGFVHDPGAAMMGGVGGHAGLFSNAWDLAVLMHMLERGGDYAGMQFLSPETISEYTTCHFCYEDNRRGIGFDKPTLQLNAGPTCNEASASSFGHSGFTGTLTWADPEHDLVYVFLSNRIYPDAANRKLITLDIRTRIQEVIYQAYGIQPRPERLPNP